MLNTLAVDRASIVDIDVQLAILERTRITLRHEKTLAEERLNSYRYPVLTLPHELTSIIFLHFIPDYPLCSPLAGPFSPNVLAQVCRQWRDISLSIPELWRATRLSAPAGDLASLLDLHLARSRGRPLSLELDESSECRIPREVFEVISAHGERLEYLNLTLWKSEREVQLIAAGSMPLLRSLTMVFETEVGVEFSDAPRLTTVVLDVCAAVSIALPWNQITSLTLTVIYLRLGLAVVSQARNLTYCELRVLHDWDNADLGPGVPLLSLTTLILHSEDYEAIPALRPFITPALRTLSVPEIFLAPDPIASLTTFIARTGCTLVELSVTGGRSVTRDSYREAWPTNPTLRFDESSEEEDEDENGEDSDTSSEG
ncbi:hypothetical protein C8R46DRAFT_1057219 [Mycena filopes]|nr:hypothetical protein C8R46DRAFT_1057219 [Mycena filopes]